MRLIGSLDNSTHAQRFSAYLTTEGINNHIEHDQNEFEIWIKDEDVVEKASAALSEFNVDPEGDIYKKAVVDAESMVRAAEKKRQQAQKRIVKVNMQGRGQKKAPLTKILIGLSIFVALATNLGENRDSVVFRALAFTSVGPPAGLAVVQDNDGDYESLNVRYASLKRGELWRMITPIFIHFGFWHIAFNMYFLFYVGTMVEDRYGTFWLAIMVIVGAIIPNLVQCGVPIRMGGAEAGFSSGYLIIALGGMSGVVLGLFGFVWMKSLFDRSSGFFLPPLTVAIVIGFMLFHMLSGVESNVANWAHGVGLAIGMLLGYWPSTTGPSSGRT